MLGTSLVSWRSKKQDLVSCSSTEAEYCVLADTTCELVWLRQLWLTWMFHSLLPLFFIVIIVVLSTLLIKMSSINAPSTLRSIAITLASISRKAISSYSPSPLPSNLLISSPKLNRLVVFEIQYPNSNWLPPYHLEFEEGCQYITQFSLAYRAQPSIQYLWYSHITCTSHILNLYEALYCTTLFIQNIQTIQSFSLTLIFLTYIYI